MHITGTVVRRAGILLCALAVALALVVHAGEPRSVTYAASAEPAPLPTQRRVPGVISIGQEIFVFGGISPAGTPLTTVEAYDVAANRWSSKPSLPAGQGLTYRAALGSDGKIYLLAVNNSGSTVLKTYDPVPGVTADLPDPPVANRYAVAMVADAAGGIYLIGGAQECCPYFTGAVDRYDVQTGTWSTRRPMPTPRLWATAALGADGAIYVVGGRADADNLATVERYDIATDTWAARRPMPTPRTGAGLALAPNGRLHAFGGFHADPAFSAMEEYDATTDTWVSRRRAPEGRYDHAFLASNGRFYAIGGMQNGPPQNVHVPTTTMLVYDPATDSWLPDRVAPVITSFIANDGTYLSNSLQVTLAIRAADEGDGVESMSFSNDGTTWSPWQPFAPTASWTLVEREDSSWYGIFARVRDHAGNVSNPPTMTTIRVDLSPPTGSVTVPATASASGLRVASPVRQVLLTAADNLTPQDQIQMRLSNRPDFAGAIWKPFASSTTWDFSGGATVYAQFKDGAGNLSLTYSQSIAGSPSGGTSPTPTCSPRPRISVQIEPAITPPEEPGAIWVTISTTGSNNGLHAVRFDSFANARVSVGSQENQSAPFAVSIPPGQEPTSLRFFVQRQVKGQSTTVRLSVIDGCGEWSTFVGGGPSAF